MISAAAACKQHVELIARRDEMNIPPSESDKDLLIAMALEYVSLCSDDFPELLRLYKATAESLLQHIFGVGSGT